MTRARLWIALLLLVVACDPTGPMPEPTRVALEPLHADGNLRLLFGGDTMLDDLALPWLLEYGWGYSLAGLAPLFAEADLVTLNLEVPVADACDRSLTKSYAYFMKPEALTGLVDSHVRAVNLANNHFRDCGDAGKRSTVAALDRYGLLHFGAAPDETDANRPLILTLGDTRIGLLGFYNTSSLYSVHGTARLSEANLRRLIGGLRPLVDVLIVNVHWGRNYARPLGPNQETYGRLAVELGADVVIGHGAHIPQTAEMHQGKPIFYSVGNLAFGTGNSRAYESLLLDLRITDKRLDRIWVQPLFTDNRNPRVLWQTRLAVGNRARGTLRRLVKSAAARGLDIRVHGDRGEITLP